MTELAGTHGIVLGLFLFLWSAAPILAQGNVPIFIHETVVYGPRTFRVTFSMYEREDVRAAPGTGAPLKEWISENSVVIHALSQPEFGRRGRALTLKLSTWFRDHYGLRVNAKPESTAFNGAERGFTNLCWKEGW